MKERGWKKGKRPGGRRWKSRLAGRGWGARCSLCAPPSPTLLRRIPSADNEKLVRRGQELPAPENKLSIVRPPAGAPPVNGRILPRPLAAGAAESADGDCAQTGRQGALEGGARRGGLSAFALQGARSKRASRLFVFLRKAFIEHQKEKKQQPKSEFWKLQTTSRRQQGR